MNNEWDRKRKQTGKQRTKKTVSRRLLHLCKVEHHQYNQHLKSTARALSWFVNEWFKTDGPKRYRGFASLNHKASKEPLEEGDRRSMEGGDRNHWKEATGVTGRRRQESLEGGDRNHWKEATGITGRRLQKSLEASYSIY